MRYFDPDRFILKGHISSLQWAVPSRDFYWFFATLPSEGTRATYGFDPAGLNPPLWVAIESIGFSEVMDLL